MKTPIYDFVKEYAESGFSRLHMPGHKGKGQLGCEAFDLTEITGADVLYSADGIIAESENNASALFGSAHTFYSTEGSTLCIKAMLALAAHDTPKGHRPLVLAARNVHKAFVYACALLDLDVNWLYPKDAAHLCECVLSAEDVRASLNSAKQKPCAVYLTSPDYLGNIADIEGISRVCDAFGVPLLVDNAHGAYLKFLTPSLHPLDLGASMCCDSAHKTLPVLTGGAYLHIANKAKSYAERARNTLAIFASTSPSYLTLASLDLCNAYIKNGYAQRLERLVHKLDRIKRELADKGWHIFGDEPLKLTVSTYDMGYTGKEIAERLRKKKIECEFADDEFVVLMVSAENIDAELEFLYSAFASFKRRAPIAPRYLPLSICERAMSIREATFCSYETVNLPDAVGRICASPTVSCPPAVPITVSGEIINEETVRLLEGYGALGVNVVKQ